MHATSTYCRQQQARHERAGMDTASPSVRRRSAGAAAAWCNEAMNADRREAMGIGAASAELDPAAVADNLDGSMSENPDRGLAGH